MDDLITSIREQLAPAQDETKKILADNGKKPKVFSVKNFFEFFTSIPTVMRMILAEPEILIFVILQWIAICLAYLAWIQMLKWIPDQMWDAVRQHPHSGTRTLVNLALIVWSIFIIVIVSYPIAICSAAMVAVHNLRTLKEKSIFTKCLAIATYHTGRLWLFTIIDAYMTISIIADRLPKKGQHSLVARIENELAYYAWKISTMTVLPSLVNGRGFIQAGKDAIFLLTSQPGRAIGIRFGYSAVCWVVGVISYIGAIIFVVMFGDVHNFGHTPHYIYNLYFFMATPIVVAVGIISVLVRPFFLLAVAKFYTDLIDVREATEKESRYIPTLSDFLLSWNTIIFLVLVLLLAVCLLYSDQIGLTALIHRLANQDLTQASI